MCDTIKESERCLREMYYRGQYEPLTRRRQHMKPGMQPSFKPSPTRPGRVTNQLQFLQKIVLELVKHRYAYAFLTPIDGDNINLPNFHEVIKEPMDLGTIEKRLRNTYYWSGKECIKDIYTMFTNCYMYSKPGDEVLVQSQTLERLFFMRVFDMPKIETVVDTTSQRARSVVECTITSGCTS